MKRTSLASWCYACAVGAAVSLLVGLPSCNDGSSGCPSAAPLFGESCDLPEGTQCGNYPQPDPRTCRCCGEATDYVCSGGKWSSPVTDKYSLPNGAGACPSTAPTLGASCNSYGGCGSPIPSCNYSCDDAGASPFVMGCQEGQWILVSGTLCESPDGGIESDSGDASTDASSSSGDASDGG